MDKEFLLDQIKLLSALESWACSVGSRLPDYLSDQISACVDRLSRELLK